MLPEDLIARLRARAADPKRRSDAIEALQATLQDMAGPGPKPTRIALGEGAGDGLGGLMQLLAGALCSGRGFNPQAIAERIAEDVRSGKTSMEEALGGAARGTGMEIYEGEIPPGAPGELPPPAPDAAIAAAESALGRPLPADLKQLYGAIADGGFGPGTGFLSLTALAAQYRAFRAEPQGPGDEAWPAHLLPVVPVDMGEACYDLDSGRIVCWDREELPDEDAEAEEAEAAGEAWARSFKPWADSLADWLEAWLAQPPLAEQLAAQHESGLIENVRIAIAALRDMTPEQRAEMGLPEEGWEEQVCWNHGVDPGKVL